MLQVDSVQTKHRPMHIIVKILLISLLISSLILGTIVINAPSKTLVLLSLIPLGATVLLATVVFTLIAQPQTVQRWLNIPQNLRVETVISLGTKVGIAGLFLLGAWAFVVGASLATLRM